MSQGDNPQPSVNCNGLDLSLQTIAGRSGGGRGARLPGAAEALFESIGTARSVVVRRPFECDVASARALLREEAFQRACQDGRVMSVKRSTEYTPWEKKHV